MPLHPGVQIAVGFAAVSTMMIGLWLVQRRTGNAGIVDVGWTAGIGLLGIFFAATSGGYLPRRILVAALIGVWSFRLAVYLLRDRVIGQPENRGKTCRAGWWRYSRHPNYFFEWLHWWTYVVLAAGAPYWWVTLGAPATMLYFLLFVTGIPPTEAQALASRGDDYRRYQQTTSVFIPWFPKKERRRE